MCFFKDFFCFFTLGNVNVHLENHGGTINIGKWDIINIKHASVWGGDLPVVGLTGFKYFICLTELTRSGVPKTILITVPASGLAEPLTKVAVDEGNAMVRC